MNDKLSPIQQELLMRADSIFKTLGEAATKAYDVASTQLPDLAVQYVLYGRVSATTIIVLALLAIIASVHYTKKYFAESNGTILVITEVTGILSAAVIIINLPNFLLVWFAPKIWLMQEIVHLVKR